MKVTIVYHGGEVVITEIEPILAELAEAEVRLTLLFKGFDGSDPARLRRHHDEIVRLHEQIVELDLAVVTWNRAVERENAPIQDRNILAIWTAWQEWNAARDAADKDHIS